MGIILVILVDCNGMYGMTKFGSQKAGVSGLSSHLLVGGYDAPLAGI